MKSKQNGMKVLRAWLDWLFLWLAWTISTTLGWFLTGMLTLVMAFAFAIPDPDAARAYLSSSPWERLFTANYALSPRLRGSPCGALLDIRRPRTKM